MTEGDETRGTRLRTLAVLFWDFFSTSLFVIGGGYAIIAVADRVAARRKWIQEGELLDHLGVFQMIPGLIATHSAVYVGRKVAGPLGALVGVLAVALPSVVIFTFVSAGYDAIPLENAALKSVFVGLRCALTGIVAATVVRSWLKGVRDVFSHGVLLAGVLALLAGVRVPAVLLLAILAGLVRVFQAAGRKRRFAASWLPLLVFLKYGSLCFGGGFVLVPMYLEDFVGASAAWLQVPEESFSNLMALTQMTPGPIGVNGATYFGFCLAGTLGAVLASAALLLPGSFLSYLALASLDRFRQSRIVGGILAGVRPASVALMLVALKAFAQMSLFDSSGRFDPLALLLVLACLFVSVRKRLGPVPLILLSALVALVSALILGEVGLHQSPMSRSGANASCDLQARGLVCAGVKG